MKEEHKENYETWSFIPKGSMDEGAKTMTEERILARVTEADYERFWEVMAELRGTKEGEILVSCLHLMTESYDPDPKEWEDLERAPRPEKVIRKRYEERLKSSFPFDNLIIHEMEIDFPWLEE